MSDNRGAQRLRALGLTQYEIAAAVGTDQSVVSRWQRGGRKPDASARARIEDAYGIGWRTWDEPPEPEQDAEDAAPTGDAA